MYSSPATFFNVIQLFMIYSYAEITPPFFSISINLNIFQVTTTHKLQHLVSKWLHSTKLTANVILARMSSRIR